MDSWKYTENGWIRPKSDKLEPELKLEAKAKANKPNIRTKKKVS